MCQVLLLQESKPSLRFQRALAGLTDLGCPGHRHMHALVGYSPLGHTQSDTTKVKGSGTPLPYSCLENPMDGEVWWVAVHGVAKSRTRLSDFTFTFHFHALEKEMATHSSVLA